MNSVTSWILGRVYTKKTMAGAGAIKGDKGDKGDAGTSLQSMSINANNHLIATLTDATTVDAGELPKEEVAISSATGNALSKKTDGLYVATTGVEISKTTGNIIQNKSDGLYAKADEIKISSVAQNHLSLKADGLYAEGTDISGKVDKVTGKGLSTNDYDATEKAEVAKIAGKIDKAQGSANAGKILVVGTDGNVTLGDDKGSDVVTAWETTPVDTKVPSEKLVKDTIDGIDATKLNVDNTATTKQTIKANLDGKVDIKQKVADKGKSLVVGADGNLALDTIKGLEIVDKTKAEYDALTEAEKKDATKLYNITDADDLDLSNYVNKVNIVKAFNTTLSDEKIPSEKLVKDSLDDKADSSSVQAIYDGGYASKNLLNVCGSNGVASINVYGISATRQTDGTYSVSGTCTNDTLQKIYEGNDIPFGVRLRAISGNNVNKIRVLHRATSSTGFVELGKDYIVDFTIPQDSYSALIQVEFSNGVEYSQSIKPMITTDLTATEFVQYVKSNVELTEEVNNVTSDVDCAYDNGFVSRNLFDEQMEIGGIDITSGASVTYATRMRSVNYTEIDATKSYYICTQSTVSTSATKLRVFYYDSSKAFVSYQDWTNELTIPSGAKYIRFITIDGYGTTYNNDIILNVSDSKNGTYQPYAKSNIELTKIVNDDLKMLGWTVPSECPIQNYTDSNGVFHQRVGRVDLGSLAWGYLTSPAPYFGTDLSNIKINTNNMYCKSYPITKSNVGIANMPDKTLKSDGGSYAKVYVKDSAYTDATAFKSAMSGVYLYYELATEITKSVDGNEYGIFDKGQTASTTCAKNSVTQIPITFNKTFNSAPIVVATMVTNSSGVDVGNMTVAVMNIITTGATLYVYNNGASDRKPALNWIAIQ